MTTAIHKFGGAALMNVDAIRHAASIIAIRQAQRIAVVASAMGAVTDTLLQIGVSTHRGDLADALRTSADLRERHAAVARALVVDDDRRGALEDSIDAEFDALDTIARSLAAGTVPLDAAMKDRIVARGERLSAHLLAAGLVAADVRAVYLDATTIVYADGRHGDAIPDLQRTTDAVRSLLLPHLDERMVPVVPGYIAGGPDGAIVTLGRGGSDLTATVLARALDATSVTLWKDVPGVLTADPRVVPNARLIPRLHVREAAELAYYGAKILHPRALLGLRDTTRLFIRPLADPDAAGTEISTRRDLPAEKRLPVRAITAIGAQAIITISGDGMVGVPGIAARAFGALQEVDVSVALISQASSEHSICLAVPSTRAAAAESALRGAFASQLERGEVERIDVRIGASILAVVGLGMAGRIGIAARLFAAIAESNTSVIAIAQGASELNISVVVDESDAPIVQRAVHAAFHLDKIGGGAALPRTRADVVILGFGRIGRELATQLGRAGGRGPNGVRVVAVIDSHGFLLDARGLSARRLAVLGEGKKSGGSLAEAPRGVRASAAEALDRVARHALSRPILVDVTAGDTTELLERALAAGMDIVLANKTPLAAPRGANGGLIGAAALQGRRVLHEATVGAGLPLIDTIRKLQESGDRVLQIEGCPSGTLGYLFGELERGTPFSVALRQAMALGYTEPDPREDLSGMDVARKALILGRLLGYHGDLDAVPVESLVPDAYRAMPAADFVERLEELDAGWQQRVQRAREAGTVLRYRATISGSGVDVGLVGVTPASSFASLTGTDNQFAIMTTRYRTNPIVITGPGAGVEVTAAGVLNDILKLAGSR